jgi:thioredoxin reductase (NADPH)
MAKPVLLTVDDDIPVLRAIERDLRSRYGDRYRVLRADSGPAAFEIVQQLKRRNDAVALLLVDHRMPRMSGIEFLAQASRLYPEAKRVLLTAYADSEAAIRAINDVRLHHYLLKPWDPPEQHLYPVLNELLEDWQASFKAPYDGLRVLGTRWSRQCYAIRDFLARNHVPHQWLDADAKERDSEINQLMESLGPDSLQLPLVLFPDGTRLARASIAELAARVGLKVHADTDFYDLVVVGAGPAGLAAAVYGASEGLRTVLVEREAPGGQASSSSRIENYLGFPTGLSGGELANRAVIQARRFGAEILTQDARALRSEGPYRIVELGDGIHISCHAMLIATGVQWRRLNAPGVEELRGAGIYYGGGLTEAMSCRDEQVFIVGGANSAGQAAMHFSSYARKVIMLVRGKSLSATMSRYLVDQIERTPNIEIRCGASLVAAHGEEHLESIDIRCADTGDLQNERASAVFIFIGAEPKTEWVGECIQRDERGFILTGVDLLRDGKRPRGWELERTPGILETSMPGVFAAGDVRHGSVKRVASGVGEGAMAVQLVHQYLAKV